MRKIIFYISGLGFGHLTRSMAVVRELIKTPAVHVTLKCHSVHVPMAAATFHGQAEQVCIQPFDCGFSIRFAEKTSRIDLTATLRSVDAWLERLEAGAQAEAEACRGTGYSLVLSDIAPEAFGVAERLGIPAIGLSNYTWYEFLKEFIGSGKLEQLKAMYQTASAFLEYPLSTGDEMPINGRTPVGLVSRPQDQARISQLRQTFKRPGRLLLFLSVGGALSLRNVRLSSEIDYLHTRGIELPSGDNAIKVPADTADTQNYLAACDGVITKCGWSTVAEALIAKKPLFLLRTGEGGIEERHLLQELANLGVSRVLEPGDELHLEQGLFDNLAELQDAYKKAPARYTDQVKTIAGRVLKQLSN